MKKLTTAVAFLLIPYSSKIKNNKLSALVGSNPQWPRVSADGLRKRR